mgnify:CR=1 FL=1|jgi:hypothetical protein
MSATTSQRARLPASVVALCFAPILLDHDLLQLLGGSSEDVGSIHGDGRDDIYSRGACVPVRREKSKSAASAHSRPEQVWYVFASSFLSESAKLELIKKYLQYNECDVCEVVLCTSCLADGFECAMCNWLVCAVCYSTTGSTSISSECALTSNDGRHRRTSRCARCEGLAESTKASPSDGVTEPSGAPFPLAFDPSGPSCERMRLR